MINGIHITVRQTYICAQTIETYGSNFANGYTNTLLIDHFTQNSTHIQRPQQSHTHMAFRDYAVIEHVFKSTSVSAFWLVSTETLSWAPVCYPTGWVLNNIVVFWKMLYRTAWRFVSSCETKAMVSWKPNSCPTEQKFPRLTKPAVTVLQQQSLFTGKWK